MVESVYWINSFKRDKPLLALAFSYLASCILQGHWLSGNRITSQFSFLTVIKDISHRICSLYLCAYNIYMDFKIRVQLYRENCGKTLGTFPDFSTSSYQFSIPLLLSNCNFLIFSKIRFYCF